MIKSVLFMPWPPRRAACAVVIAGVLLLAAFDRSAGMKSARWDIDEGQRIGESYFLRLLEEGEVNHPDWFRAITDSSHPQLNKYFFGLAVQLHGVDLPRDLALPRYYEASPVVTDWQPPPHLLPVYEPMLRPARRAAMLCNTLSFVVVIWLLLRWGGLGSAAIAAVLFLRHYLTASFFVTAGSDALQTCAFTLVLIPLSSLLFTGGRDRRMVLDAMLVGIFSAISFQTRLNGLLALGGAGVVLLVFALREKTWRPVIALAIATITCVVVSVVSNPYYWAKPLSAPGVAQRYLTDDPLAVRVASRFVMQIRDLEQLLSDHSYAALPMVADRVRFVSSVLFSGIAGLLLLGGVVAAFVTVLLSRPARTALGLPCLWSASVITAFTLWIPLSWDHFAFLILPTTAMVAAAGWNSLALLLLGSRADTPAP